MTKPKSLSVMRREAIQRGEPMPTFSSDCTDWCGVWRDGKIYRCGACQMESFVARWMNTEEMPGDLQGLMRAELRELVWQFCDPAQQESTKQWRLWVEAHDRAREAAKGLERELELRAADNVDLRTKLARADALIADLLAELHGIKTP